MRAGALRHRPLLIAGGLVVLIGAFAAAFSRKDAAVDAGAARPAAVPSGGNATGAAEDANKRVETATVQLSIHVKPASATVTLDGARLVSNPFQADVNADKRAHVLRASAPGYQPVEQVITFGNDSRIDIVLKPMPGAAGKAARAAEAASQRSTLDNWKPTGGEITRATPEPAPSEARPREPDVELKRSPATPPRTIDEKDPYSP
jgi:hypothetical protein